MGLEQGEDDELATCSTAFKDGIFRQLDDQFIPQDTPLNIESEFICTVLETLYPYLDLFSRKSSSHIDPLHVQRRKKRDVMIAEHVHLHLVWSSSVIYIKPIPNYLLDDSFWKRHLQPSASARCQALGFLRTYAYLIQHPSDFRIAQSEGLLPSSQTLSYGDWHAFLQQFRNIGDDEVGRRWEFGQLRLRRLSWAVRIFQPRTKHSSQGGMFYRLFYEETYHETSEFVRGFGAPFLFVFATLSLILSSMQVILAARDGDQWPGFPSITAWFSVVVIVIILVMILLVMVVSVAVLVLQLGFAMKVRRRCRVNVNDHP